ncbi:MAG: hypothetical protein HN922_08570 [Anaerolineae bacterium]|nr:hypothetical protein [Anaerolineae bacterium]MBT7782413.1 hypothetical protein [Anaerolineae bacterium]
MSSLDLLGDIPHGERILLKIFLRNTSLSKDEFSQLAETLPEKKGLSSEEVHAALSGLLLRGWLKEDGENYTLLQQKSQGSRQRGQRPNK